MSSSLQLNHINILQLNQCDSEKLRFLSPPPPPSPAAELALAAPKPLTTSSAVAIDNANRIGRRQNDNKTLSHHQHRDCYHARGEIPCNFEWSCNGTATKGSAYTPPPSFAAPNNGQHHDQVGTGEGADVDGGAGASAGGINGSINSTCKGICCAVVESVQCASALVDDNDDDNDKNTHHDGGNGTLTTTVDSNFKCVSTSVSGNGRVTCAVLPQPRPLECVHKRYRRTERLATETAPPASSIQEPSKAEADKHIGKHLSQASSNSRTLATNTDTTNTTTTSWASTSSVSSPPSVQDFAKCLTAEEKASSPPKRTENSLAKGPPSVNSCDFVLSELYFSPFGDIFCYNLDLDPCRLVFGAAETLQALLIDSLGHFCDPKRIFLVASQSSHSQWFSCSSSSSVVTDAGTTGGEPIFNRVSVVAPPSPVQKFNYLILSASNLNNTLWFINNELVNNLNENLYFLPIPPPSSPIPSPTPTLSSLTSSSSSKSPGESESRASNFCKSSRLREELNKEQPAAAAGHSDEKPYKYGDGDKNEKVSDESRRRRRQPSLITLLPNYDNDKDYDEKVITSPARCYAYTQQKASHSLLKVSDVKKEFFNKGINNNDNNDNKQQCNGSSTDTTATTAVPSTTKKITTRPVNCDKNTSTRTSSSHFVEDDDDAFQASQRLKRLEENFKDLTVVRKSNYSRQPSLIAKNPNNGIVPFENRLTATELTRSLIALQSSSAAAAITTKNDQHKDKETHNHNQNVKSSSKSSSSSCNNCDSIINLSLSSEYEKSLSITNTNTTLNNDVIINIESNSPIPVVINNFLSDNNNNLNLISKSDSCCHLPNNTNNHNHTNESHIGYSSFVNNNNNNNNNNNCHLQQFKKSTTKNKDIFYISRPVPSISEFDVRNLNNRNKINQFTDESVTFECYDELLDDEDEEDDIGVVVYAHKIRSRSTPQADSVFVENITTSDDDCYECADENNENACECNLCQKCRLIKFETSNEVNNNKYNNNNSANNNYYNNNNCLPQQLSVGSVKVLNSSAADQLSTTTVTDNNFDIEMREINGQLRGLLKKPNRPPPVRKNRVVFDETRNEFFEADYIILIREDCAYDEEDEEPCTCGEHELVRLCCEEGCQCNYTNEDTRTPQVSD